MVLLLFSSYIKQFYYNTLAKGWIDEWSDLSSFIQQQSLLCEFYWLWSLWFFNFGGLL